MENLTPLHGTPPKKGAPQISHIRLKDGIAAAKELAKAATADKFPIDVFPDKIQAVINDMVTNLKAVPDFIGSALLLGASVAIGNRFRVRIKEGHLQSAALYIAVVGKPNTGKTFPFGFALRPFERLEREFARKYKEARKEYTQTYNAYQALSKEEKASRNEPVPPVYRQYLLKDTTPEALIKALADNPEGIALFRDELAAWVMNFSRYQKGDEEQMWLELWDNKPAKSNRISRGVTEVFCPFVSVGGGLQPETLKQIGKGRTDNGFIDRILFAFPSGVKKETQPETDISPQTPQIWRNVIVKILGIPLRIADSELNIPEPRLLWLSEEARAKYKAFDMRITELCNMAENEPFAGAWGKLDMQVARLALIMELLQFACADSTALPVEVSGIAMERAIKLADYFRTHAKRAISLIKEINPLEGMPTNFQKLYNELPAQFQRRDAIAYGAKFSVKGGTLSRFLDNDALFERVKSGYYAKKI